VVGTPQPRGDRALYQGRRPRGVGAGGDADNAANSANPAAALAQKERALISQRTKEGLKAAKDVPQVLVYGGSVQYSMAYLKSEVQDLQLPDFINHLIPIVEAQFSTPVANNFGNSFVTTGTINPGAIWVGSYFQIGVEAIIPVNRASGTGVGVIAQLHLYLDDIFPTSYGQPRRPSCTI
jgi:hypothetical protein